MLSIFLSLSIGAKSISLNEVYSALFLGRDSFNASIVRERIPRTIFAIFAGISLAYSGILIQGLTRNPVADPGILGINTGASLAVVVGIVYFGLNTARAYFVFALCGAFIATILIYILGSLGFGGQTSIKLILAGSACSAIMLSLINTLLLPRARAMETFRFWQIGSVSGATMEQLSIFIPLSIILIVYSLYLSRNLDIFYLGDEMAVSLGVNIIILKISLIVVGVSLCAFVTAIGGPIGFVGIIVPHIIRKIVGEKSLQLLIFSGIYGAVLLCLSDILGRLIAFNGELEAGIITAFIGAPILIYVATRKD